MFQVLVEDMNPLFFGIKLNFAGKTIYMEIVITNFVMSYSKIIKKNSTESINLFLFYYLTMEIFDFYINFPSTSRAVILNDYAGRANIYIHCTFASKLI